MQEIHAYNSKKSGNGPHCGCDNDKKRTKCRDQEERDLKWSRPEIVGSESYWSRCSDYPKLINQYRSHIIFLKEVDRYALRIDIPVLVNNYIPGRQCLIIQTIKNRLTS